MFQSDDGRVICVVEVTHPKEMFNAVPKIVNHVLDEHEFILGQLLLCQPGSLPKSRRGEIQRLRVQRMYKAGQMYVFMIGLILTNV